MKERGYVLEGNNAGSFGNVGGGGVVDLQGAVATWTGSMCRIGMSIVGAADRPFTPHLPAILHLVFCFRLLQRLCLRFLVQEAGCVPIGGEDVHAFECSGGEGVVSVREESVGCSPDSWRSAVNLSASLLCPFNCVQVFSS